MNIQKHALRRRKRSASTTRRLGTERLEDRRLLAITSPVELSSLLPSGGGDGSDGAVIRGGSFEKLGSAVSSAGDVNADGFDDFIVSTPDAAPNGIQSGKAYVVFGGASGPPALLDATSLNGTNGFAIHGANEGDLVGFDIDRLGDVNGDDIDDIIVGAASADANNPNAGAAYVLFGRTTAFPAVLDPTTLDGSDGFAIRGAEVNGFLGVSVAGSGDVNADGLQDIFVGSYLIDAGGILDTGRAYVVFGSDSGFGATMDVSSLNGSNGFSIDGQTESDFTAFDISGAGDVNGDGIDDMLVSSPMADPGNRSASGAVHVIFGKSDGFDATINPALLDGSDGFSVYGDVAGEQLAESVDGIGDFNGDGFDDIALGAPGGGGNGILGSGNVYVIYGTDSFPATIPAEDIFGETGIFIGGGEQNDRIGTSVAGAGDINGDGFDDLIIGASSADSTNNTRAAAGESYVVFGVPGTVTNVNLLGLDGTDGFALHGITGLDVSGGSVETAGDTNGDGFDDLLIGARGANPDFSQVGEAYLFYGGDHSDSVTHLGTSGIDIIVGDAMDNVMVGGRGDDTLLGSGGADVLRGGLGDDKLSVSDGTFLRVVGGRGHDTFAWNVAGTVLDLSSIPDNRILGVEQIDLAGTGSSLAFGLTDILNISDESNALIVTGDASNRVQIDNDWLFVGTESFLGDTLDVYEQGRATIKISQQLGTQPPLVGDFDADGDLDCDDVDALIDEINGGASNLDFDVNNDAFIDLGDLNVWVLDLKGTFFGDANLDLAVDLTDLHLWNTAKSTDATSWCTGNFDGDGDTDVFDFALWNANKFTNAPTPTPPSTPPTTGVAERHRWAFDTSRMIESPSNGDFDGRAPDLPTPVDAPFSMESVRPSRSLRTIATNGSSACTGSPSFEKLVLTVSAISTKSRSTEMNPLFPRS